MGAELEDWTHRKEHRPTWSTVLKVQTKCVLSHRSAFVFLTFLSVCSPPLPFLLPFLLPSPPSPPVWLRTQPLLFLHSIPLKPALLPLFLSLSGFLPDSHFPLL